MSIHLLPEDVAARIAAGEVVERPASVVKELVENSLDAGATRIEVETQEGGKTLIRVRDNGAGILAAEVELAFRRHSTSKLETADDLERIATLGFRGEALSSIASVSRTTCITRHVSEPTGMRVRLEAGSVVSRSAVGRPPGTELLIEDLFYNVPARRKFLNSERTERGHIDAFITRYAVAYPGIAFTVVHNGRAMLNTTGSGDAREALIAVYGMDLGASLLPIPAGLTAESLIQVGGFVGPTTVHRANRGYITLFINGRWITDLRVTYAIIQAYQTFLPVKRFPVAFVQVEVPPEDIDVNVHPAKAEVRFRDADAVFRAVQRAVRATVVGDSPVAAPWSAPDAQPGPSFEPAAPASTRARLAALQPAETASSPQYSLPGASTPPGSRLAASGSTASAQPASAPVWIQASEAAAPGSRPSLPPLRVIGQASTMFIIAEGPDGLYLIDQHAAHERILYERMLADVTRGTVPAQTLLEPAVVSLPLDEAVRLEPLLDILPHVGLEVESFGPAAFLVRALPVQMAHIAPSDLLADVAAADEGHSPVDLALEEQVIRRICKRAAVKAGQVLTREEMERLVRDLEQTTNPRTCPHGRPTIVQISVESLARQFGRS